MKADYWCLQYSQDQGREFSSQINRKLLDSPQEGVMEAPLLHTQTHSPLTEGKVRPCTRSSYFLLLHILHEGQEF